MLLDLLAVQLLHVRRHAGRIVVGPRVPREAVDEHERRHTLGMRRSGDDRHLRRLALRDDRRLARPDGVHHRLEIVYPRLDRDHSLRDAGARHPDTPHVEPEHREKRRERLMELVQQRLLGDRLEVARPVEDEDDVRRPVADDLVRDVGIAGADVLRAPRHQAHSATSGPGRHRRYASPMRTCPSCGRENADDARFCSRLRDAARRHAARAREERKVVTFLFCDLVGFTARAERWTRRTCAALLQPYHARVRGELERFGGTVEKFIGDAVMAVFGAPIAHEDDPERAVRAALAIREALAEDGELEVRIGITTGEALVALGARPDAGEGMASGDVVNTAARLQAAAPTNGDPRRRDDATARPSGRSSSARREPVEAKGKAEPVPAWEARAGARARRRRARRRQRRSSAASASSTLLRESLRARPREREPQLVTLVGVPGIGKSRLVYELFADASSRRPELVVLAAGPLAPVRRGRHASGRSARW